MKEIVQVGDPVLREVAKPVAKKDIGSRKLASVIARMKGLLAQEDYGVAIAAPQIGESLQIFVIAGKAFEPLRQDDENGLASAASDLHDEASPAHEIFAPQDMVFINPKITRLSKKQVEMSEGCLSVRGKYGTVLRHEKATVQALNESGKPFTYHSSGLIAHIFQHECDHLEGVLYTDKSIKLEEDEDIKSARTKLRKKHNI